MGFFRRSKPEEEYKPYFERHVVLFEGGPYAGLGALLQIQYLREDGSPQWRWMYDPGIPQDGILGANVSIDVEVAITKIEKELGLPFSWPDQAETYLK